MSVSKILEETPHLVEWMVSPKAERWESACFSTLKDAQIYATQRVDEKFTVWLPEIGDYLNSRGTSGRSMICYWWDESAE